MNYDDWKLMGPEDEHDWLFGPEREEEDPDDARDRLQDELNDPIFEHLDTEQD